MSGTSTDSSALANNVILKVNSMVNNGGVSDDSSLKLHGHHRDLATPSQTGSNELDSLGPWDGSSQDFRNNATTQLFRHNSDLEPDFPPKPVSRQ